jgi:ATP-dependent RNA helicase DeaD
MPSFESLGLSPALLDNIVSMGYENPTPIQQQVIPILLSGDTDMVALAQTGTGKTAAFGLPLVELCDEELRTVQALVLAPTRELCVQISDDLREYAKNVKKLNIVAVYGGTSISDQIRQIGRGCHIVVATPGRLIDLLERGAVKLNQINYFVLDEADEMLKMGFQEAIDTILGHTTDEKCVWLFSATMPPEIARIASKYMSTPAEVSVGNKNQSNENIVHQYVLMHDRDRYQALKRIIDFNYDMYGVIFCRTKIEAQDTAENLMRDGYNADSLHGDLSQLQRDRVLNSFRKRTLQILVATDVAARGIDITDISHVIHYNIPDELEYYTHRSGRTARAGKTGISIAFISLKELFKLRQIERMLKVRFEKINIPTGKEVCHQKMLRTINEVHDVEINEAEIKSFLPLLNEAFSDLSKEEVIKRFASLEFNHFLDYYRNSIDLNVVERDGGSPRGDSKRSVSDRPKERYSTGSRLFVNLGKMDGFEKRDMVDFLAKNGKVHRSDIDRLEIKGAYSFFEVAPDLVAQVRKNLHGGTYGNREVRIEVADGKFNDEGDKKKDKKHKHTDKKHKYK